jgi:hypothetical protein
MGNTSYPTITFWGLWRLKLLLFLTFRTALVKASCLGGINIWLCLFFVWKFANDNFEVVNFVFGIYGIVHSVFIHVNYITLCNIRLFPVVTRFSNQIKNVFNALVCF